MTDQVIDQMEIDAQEDDKLNVKTDENSLLELNLLDNGADNDGLKHNKLKANDQLIISATPLNRMPGHTGFLTFATKL